MNTNKLVLALTSLFGLCLINEPPANAIGLSTASIHATANSIDVLTGVGGNLNAVANLAGLPMLGQFDGDPIIDQFVNGQIKYTLYWTGPGFPAVFNFSNFNYTYQFDPAELVLAGEINFISPFFPVGQPPPAFGCGPQGVGPVVQQACNKIWVQNSGTILDEDGNPFPVGVVLPRNLINIGGNNVLAVKIAEVTFNPGVLVNDGLIDFRWNFNYTTVPVFPNGPENFEFGIDHEVQEGEPVPGPLPILGAGVAWAYAKRLKKLSMRLKRVSRGSRIE